MKVTLMSSSDKLAGEYSPANLWHARATLAKHDVTESKIRRFWGGVKGILPLILPQKRSGIGKGRIQQLSNPPGAHLIMYQVRGGDAYEC